MKTVLFLGGWHATTIWFFKIHGGKEKYRLWVADCWEECATRFSKYCEKFFLLPHHCLEDQYTDKIIEIYRQNKFDALIPIPHEEVLLISKYKKKLQDAGVPIVISDLDTMQTTVDKEKLGIFCNENDIPYPATFAGDKFDGKQILKKAALPIIVKLKAGTNQVDQRICQIPEEFLTYFSLICNKHGKQNVIAQKFIPGYELDSMFTSGVFCDKNHNILGIFPTKKIRSRPYSGGAGICTRTVDDHQVETICREVVTSLGRWQAICNIEVKRDIHTGKYFLIEINPRAWGSPMFSITLSGVDLVDLWIKLTTGEKLPKEIKYQKKGIYSTEMFHDFILLTDLLKDLPDKNKRKKAWESLKSYRYPYFSNTNGVTRLQAIADVDLRDLRVFWKKNLRLKKRLFDAVKPTNHGRKEGEYLSLY